MYIYTIFLHFVFNITFWFIKLWIITMMGLFMYYVKYLPTYLVHHACAQLSIDHTKTSLGAHPISENKDQSRPVFIGYMIYSFHYLREEVWQSLTLLYFIAPFELGLGQEKKRKE